MSAVTRPAIRELPVRTMIKGPRLIPFSNFSLGRAAFFGHDMAAEGRVSFTFATKGIKGLFTEKNRIIKTCFYRKLQESASANDGIECDFYILKRG